MIKLPEAWKIHTVFNIQLLEGYKGVDFKQQVIQIEAEGEDWVMDSIIASGPSDDNPKQHVFLVKWKDFWQEQNTWETYENVKDNKEQFFEDYYARNPAVEKDARFKIGYRKIGRKMK
jgi:hypothetical protein